MFGRQRLRRCGESPAREKGVVNLPGGAVGQNPAGFVEQRLDDIPTYRLLPPFALAEQDVLAPPVDGHHIHLRLPRPEAAYAFRQEGHLAQFGYIAHINILVVFSLYK